MNPAPEGEDTFAPQDRQSLADRILPFIAQHRMATTAQVQQVLLPTNRPHVSRNLNQLQRRQLVDHVVLPRSNRTRAWYLTSEGARLTQGLPELQGRPPYPVTSASAASLRTAHTLTAVRAHAAFVTDARRRSDEHGPWDWTPEVAHNLGEGERLIADALMHYTLSRPDGGRTKLRAFIEVDRSTMSSERMASKLIEYARFHLYQPVPVGRRKAASALDGPLWKRWYPVFPRVLFVLTNASRRTLANRTADLRSMAEVHPAVTELARHVPLGAAILEDLEQHGPSSPIWTPLTGDAEQRPWNDL